MGDSPRRRQAGQLAQLVLLLGFVYCLYLAGKEAYKIRLYAIKTYGTPSAHASRSTRIVVPPVGVLNAHARTRAAPHLGRVIHEFDPWFNFRATKYLADNGWKKFFTWFDYESWCVDER